MIVTADNGKTYEVRFDNNGDFEIERNDADTGLRKVFVLMDFSIGNFTSKRKEMIWYSYIIMPTGVRTDKRRIPTIDNPDEFHAFLDTQIWELLKVKMLDDFLKKVESTFRITE